MSFKLTAKTRSILNQIQKNPSLVLDIEGLDIIYSSSAVFKRVIWDDGQTWDQDDLRWDSSIASDDFLSYINLSDSTRVITQQIYPDKEGSSSITSMQISIIDKDGSVSKAFALNSIGEILGKKVEALLGFVGGVYPGDFMPIMNAIIVDFYYQAGSINLVLSHADSLRNQSVLTSSTTKLTADIDSIVTTIPIADTSKIVNDSDGFKNYLKIDDEIIQIQLIDNTFVTTLERGALGTIAEPHDEDAEVKFVYTIEGKPLDIAQRLMMSSDVPFNFFESDYQVISWESDGTNFIQNAVFINHPDIERASGLVQGDFIRVLVGGTNFELTVDSFGKLDTGQSYIIVQQNLSTTFDINAPLEFRSQFNVYNFGLDMKPFEVDNAEINKIKSDFAPNFVDMRFFIEDGIENVRDFINKLYFVAGCYGIPRNARSSVKFLSPPLSSEVLPILNENTVINLLDLKPARSVNKFYYNDILFKYRKSIIDGDYKTFVEFIDADSISNSVTGFNVGKKQLTVEADGYLDNTQTTLAINRLANRFLDRYKQAATFIKDVKMPFKYGFNIQVGDVVLFGGSGVKIADYNTGKLELPIEKYEVINQKIDLNGVVSLDILSTGYAIDGTFATFSPASLVDTATTTKIKLKKINNAEAFTFERDKYQDLIGARMRVRSDDFTYDELTTITGFDLQESNTVLIEELPTAPLTDYVFELANYSDQTDYGTSDVIDAMKQRYSFTMPQVNITGGTSNTVFNVDSVANLFIGQNIAVHKPDFANNKDFTKITDITGLTITVDSQLGFTPIAGDLVETQTNLDGFDGYLFL